MPYIMDKKIRKRIDQILINNLDILQANGNINYMIAKLFKLLTQDGLMSYNRSKEFIGELECAKLEIYRRWIADYEDQKKKTNGDVD